MIDFTNNSENMMNLDSVKYLYTRMDDIYRRIIDGLIDPEDEETRETVEEYMPSLIDYILEVAQSDNIDDFSESYYDLPGLEVDMDELYDTCEFFDFDPNEFFILED